MSNWKLIKTNELAIRPSETFRDGAEQVLVVSFENEETGEIKLFSQLRVRKLGTENILKLLNKNNGN